MIDQSLIDEVIRTRKVSQHKRTTVQSIRDHEKISKRMNNLGVKYDYVSAYFEKMIGPHFTAFSLLEIATRVATKLKLKLDRLAKRNRSALLCWFGEHWSLIYPHLLTGFEEEEDYQYPTGSCQQSIDENLGNSLTNQLDILDISRLLN